MAGSAAQGTSDEHSDIDLVNYYDSLPDRAHFDGMLRALGAERVGDISRQVPRDSLRATGSKAARCGAVAQFGFAISVGRVPSPAEAEVGL
jgi:hypothetical protein